MSNRKEKFNFNGYLLSLLTNSILTYRIYCRPFALENFFDIKYIFVLYISLFFFEKNHWLTI